MNVAEVLAALVLVVGVPLNVFVTRRLRRMSRSSPQINVLRERALMAQVALLVISVFGLIFVNNDLPVPLLATDATKLITRVAVLALAVVPALYWLRLYRR